MKSRRKYLWLTEIVAVLALLVPSMAVVTSPAAAAPYCGQVWGSLSKSSGSIVHGPVTSVRAGRHACFDRIVLDVGPGFGDRGYQVRYVDQVRQDGSGLVVPTKGGAKLEIVALAPAYDWQGNPTLTDSDMPSVAGYRTFRDVTYAGSFEAHTKVGLGVRARLPFRAFKLQPNGTYPYGRIVIDVGHGW